MENYEDKYKRALKKAKQGLKSCGSDSYAAKLIYSFFPELQESGDERVRKSLIELVKQSTHVLNPMKQKAMIGWLEKQGAPAKLTEEEQNRFAKGALTGCAMSFTDYLDTHRYEGKMCVSNGECEDIENAFHNAMWDKLHRYYCKYIEDQDKQSDEVAPKFKTGDWIVSDCDNVAYIESISGTKYILQCIDGCHERMSVEYVDKCWRLWTIKNAKDGDVLHSTGWNNDCIFIFKGIDRWIFDETNRDKVVATGYCCLFVSSDKMELGPQGPDCIEVNTIQPATKIQRDLLFEKMEKAGYKWDDEKKELNKYGDNE